jgi:hypothetical protein
MSTEKRSDQGEEDRFLGQKQGAERTLGKGWPKRGGPVFSGVKKGPPPRMDAVIGAIIAAITSTSLTAVVTLSSSALPC